MDKHTHKSHHKKGLNHLGLVKNAIYSTLASQNDLKEKEW